MIDPAFPPSISRNPVIPGAYSRAYLADQHEKLGELQAIRDARQTHPGWNTLKEVLWAPLASFFQLNQAVGSFAGHLLFALPAALVGGVIGVTVYAPFMVAVDCVTGRRNTRSLGQYAIKPAQVLANLVYNRVTDVVCRYFLGPALTMAVVEPLLFVAAGTVVAAAASPFIYRDFASDGARNVERYIDCPLTTSVKHFINHYFWQWLDDVVAPKSNPDQLWRDMKACFDLIEQSGDDGLELFPFAEVRPSDLAVSSDALRLDV